MKSLSDEQFAILRRHMVEVIEIEYALASEEIGQNAPEASLHAALMTVPRHRFVPDQLAPLAYENRPLPIGFGKTISQPFLSALMIDLLGLDSGSTVLEVGTGLGYQTALLAELAGEVWSVEVVEEFVTEAQARLDALAPANVAIRVGDGTRGWPEAAPFDAILVSAAAPDIPGPLIHQLKPGGRLVMPLGGEDLQSLVQLQWNGDGGGTVHQVLAVRFTQLEIV